MDQPTHKTCRICGDTKPIDGFSRREKTRTNDGYRNDCKACVVARTSGRDRREYNREYRQQNLEHLRAQNRIRSRKNRRSPEWWKQYRAENYDAIKEIEYRYRSQNRHKAAARQLARRANPVDDTAREYIRIIREDDCVYCGGPGGTIDHIDPISRGGDNHWTNLAGACGPCNSSKGTRRLLEFLLARTAA